MHKTLMVLRILHAVDFIYTKAADGKILTQRFVQKKIHCVDINVNDGFRN